MTDQLEPQGGAEPSTKDLARSIAQTMSGAMERAGEGSPEPQPQDELEPQQYGEGGEPQLQAEPEPEPEPQADESTLSDLENTLTELGIDMGVSYADLPVEMRGTYGRLLQSAVAAATDISERELEADQAVQQVKDFSTRLRENPDKVLVAMALQYPEIFAKVTDIFERTQQSEEFRNSVIRELEADARLAEADRKEALYRGREIKAKARRVIAATQRSAAKHGVEYAAAEQVVALTIKANGGNLDPHEVDGIVADLAKKTGAPGRKPPRVVTSQQAAARRSAPQQPTPAAAPPTGKASPGLDANAPRQGGGGKFRGLVRDAFKKSSLVDQ